jgi:YfiH family protein
LCCAVKNGQTMIRQGDAVPFFQFHNLSRGSRINHFVSTRTGGVSPLPVNALNLSFAVGDGPENVAENRRILSRTVGIPLNNMAMARQVHGAHVKIVSRSTKGDGDSPFHDSGDAADALLTNVPGVCLVVLTADCVPVVLYDPEKEAVGVVHAGWKGTLQSVTRKTVEAFERHFASSPKNIVAGIGPSIGPCCYRVGSEVITQAVKYFGAQEDWITDEEGRGGYLDLWKANMVQLIQAGVREANIEPANLCTCHHVEAFFSHRCEGGRTGRFATGICLREP